MGRKCDECGQEYEVVANSYKCEEWHQQNPVFEGFRSDGRFEWNHCGDEPPFTYFILGTHWESFNNCSRNVGIRWLDDGWELTDKWTVFKVGRGQLEGALQKWYGITKSLPSGRQ
jgi:hypothetical protein